MRRFVLLDSEPILEAGEVVVEVRAAAVSTLALEFCLLLEGLADSLRLGTASGTAVLLRLTDGEQLGKATVERSAANVVSFQFGRNQAEYVQAALLRAYRDGVAEVSHIHVEGSLGDTPFDLTLLFECHREPLSADEARALLAKE